MTKGNLPVYELKIDDVETFVDAIALVESPAIEKEFLAFSNKLNVAFALNEEKMELLGAVMIPDQKIYRRNDSGFEYEVFFSKETIRKIAQSFSKKGYQSNLNIEHSGKSADSYVYQSMIVDKAMGIKPMGLPDGSWVVAVKVLNNDVWSEIKMGKHKGFSIEGFFELVESKFSKTEQNDEEEAIKLLNQIKKYVSSHI